MASRKIGKQIPIRKRGDNQCPHHDAKVKLACKDCGEELVCAQCITSKHHSHGFQNISDVATKKKNKIHESVKNAEKTQLPTVIKNLKSTNHQIKENTNHFKNLEKDIILQGKKMKDEIDRLTNEFIEKCREIEKHNFEILSKYRNVLESLYTQIKQTTDECKEALKVNNSVIIIDTEKDIQQELEIPSVPECKNVEFIAGPKSPEHLQEDFGNLFVRKGQETLVQLESRCVPKVDDIQKHWLNDQITVSEFTYSTGITSVEKSTADEVWLSLCNENYLSLVTLQGEVKQKLELGFPIQDISVSPATGNLWLCCRFDKYVYEVIGNKPTQRFKTSSCPSYLCITPDDSVVVVTDSDTVIVYNATNEVLQSTQGSNTIVSPHTVTVCTSTGDIAVCDSDLSHKGGQGKPHVSVFTSNSELDLKFRYHGPPISVIKHDFKPWDVVYDTQGRLLVADNDNKCIQLVSDTGLFLTVIHTDKQKPTALTMMQDGLLCVGFVDKKVKVIRYRV